MPTPITLPFHPLPGAADHIIAGVMPGAGKPYLLLLPTDERASIADTEWGAYGQRVTGADSDWDGLANTRALLDAPSIHPAAEAIAGMQLDTPDVEGVSELYLPSRRETALLLATVPELFKPDWYWTSTQCSADSAWYASFQYGTQTTYLKDTSLRAQAVRRLIIQ